METYSRVSRLLAQVLTREYSTSFGTSSQLLGRHIRPHIYAIYGLVRIADEIVDTYHGDDALELLDGLERSANTALDSGYSPNPIVHAYAETARAYKFEPELLQAFFASMRMDLTYKTYSSAEYKAYIHGSAEVVGLMCLHVFCPEPSLYDQLRPSAVKLGAAFQKVNFLRDIRADHELGRLYFPGYAYESFDETTKQTILADIRADFTAATAAIHKLPKPARRGVRLSYEYYVALTRKLARTPIEVVKTKRVRIGTPYKIWLFARTVVMEQLHD